MNLNHLFDLTFQARSEEPALEYFSSDGTLATISFGEVNQRSQRMASVLQRRGLKRGDRLCVYLANRIEMIDLYLACVTLGVIFVPINILYKEREVTHILRDAEPAAFVVDGQSPAPFDVWQISELASEALNFHSDRKAHPRRRRPGAYHLHIRYDRRFEGRSSNA
jgi:acyl-CoA synthetase (AMP-forming)/AMP-acid ligase II